MLLAHPGGPFFARRDQGHWTVPKGEVDAGDLPLATAFREFAEETGHRVEDVASNAANPIDLGSVIQSSGKRVFCWALEGDLDPDRATSNTFEMPWPPGSGMVGTFPEIDRVAWFGLDAARRMANPSQASFIDVLSRALAAT